ncbi:MAG: cobyrinate a,c-diamide synthase [Bacteroidales bacterium]|uniref:cobyrinate a,c-diamide synthase n=1 Tax=Porphyromonas sp. TaxID=1924944 RepID=UPI00297666B7|nr:cobyrinate a,c-diamide synthase [Porphyromonas sp.]MDD7438042.1 cobyrinate a,c-diamide synthase [Bacteroidales bacterium]MDY3067824.1 cobyrinate a,c-diamide synthase [Porphyromonas sp.]
MRHSTFMIAAPNSESGKSTITIGLLRALYKRGIQIQSFKCGPDYIDPKLHQVASHQTAINLDLFMNSEERIKEIFARYDAFSESSIVEGVMGLFDGYDRDMGSSAHLARVLGLPILLVVTPKSMAYSVAPLLYGIKHFQKDLNIVGVLFNKVNSETHYKYLLQACEDAGVRCIGKIPTDKQLELPSRYLGLETEDASKLEHYAEQSARLVEEHISIDDLLTLTEAPKSAAPNPLPKLSQLRIAVAMDEAFSFIYPENIKVLEQFGSVTYFSPMYDEQLPESDFVYLPGGYPELYLPRLSGNSSMLRSVANYAQSGRPMLAEGGGMLYLGQALIDSEGRRYPLAGVLEQEGTMISPKLTLGYRQFAIDGIEVRGHEFHYSRIIESLPSIVQQYSAHQVAVPTPLVRYSNCFATYTHLSFTSELIRHFINQSTDL